MSNSDMAEFAAESGAPLLKTTPHSVSSLISLYVYRIELSIYGPPVLKPNPFSPFSTPIIDLPSAYIHNPAGSEP